MTTVTLCVQRELLRVACSGGNEAWQALEELRALLAQPVASEPVAWLLTDQGQIAADDFEDFIRFELAEEIPEGELKRFLDAGRAEPLYRHPPAPAIPDGYALVPIEPTEAMRDAGNIYTLNRATLIRIWADMLAAAPRIPLRSVRRANHGGTAVGMLATLKPQGRKAK